MASKNNPGKFDCYENAEPDEPMFMLLGRDPMAGALVWAWADMREAQGEDPAKVAEARTCAKALDAWAKSKGKEPVRGAVVTILPIGGVNLHGRFEPSARARETGAERKGLRPPGGPPRPDGGQELHEILRLSANAGTDVTLTAKQVKMVLELLNAVASLARASR